MGLEIEYANSQGKVVKYNLTVRLPLKEWEAEGAMYDG